MLAQARSRLKAPPRLSLSAAVVLAAAALPAGTAAADHGGSPSEPPTAARSAATGAATVTGSYQVIHLDGGDQAASYAAVTTRTMVVPVELPGGHAPALVGRRVKVSGHYSDGVLQVAEMGVEVLPRTGTGARAVPARSRGLAVILYYPQGETVLGYTPGQISAKTFSPSDPTSVTSYWKAQTDGRISYPLSKGAVFGPYEVPSPGPGCHALSYWPNDAYAMADADHPGDLGADFDHFAYVLVSEAASCGAGPNAGQMPGSSVWLHHYDSYILNHELGHNYGAAHASTARCFRGSRPVTYTPGCDSASNPAFTEYEDPLDPMGGYGMCAAICEMNASRKLGLGVLNSRSVKVVKSPGRFTIKPLEASAGLRLIRIPTRRGRFFDLSFRRPIGSIDGIDGNLPPLGYSGVFLHSDGPTFSSNSILLDGNPGTTQNLILPYYQGHFGDAALRPGQTFRDRTSRAVVKVLSAGAAGAKVSIRFYCKVPKLKGKSLRRARRLLASAGCRARVRGRRSGRVRSQRPGPGKVLAPGARVTIRLR